MRVLFWMLLILNLGAFLYFNVGHLAPKNVVKATADLSPEKMKLLTDDEVKLMPQRQSTSPAQTFTPPATEPVACYEWGNFTQDELGNVVTVVNAFFIKNSVEQQSSSQSTRYWVYKPPLPSAEAANAKVQELKTLGVKDFFVVQEPKMRYAISFGIFKDETLATKLMEDLRHRGVRDVVKDVRNQGTASATLMLEGVTPTLYGQLKKNLPDYPRTEIKAVDCPNPS
jgi:hypothetical protein